MADRREQIRDFLGDFIREDDLDDGDDFFELGFVDSMFAMQLVLFVEKTFGIDVENEDLDLDNFRSVEAIDAFVGRKLDSDSVPTS